MRTIIIRLEYIIAKAVQFYTLDLFLSRINDILGHGIPFYLHPRKLIQKDRGTFKLIDISPAQEPISLTL